VAELTQEQFEQLPEFVRDDYEQAGEVYRPKAEGKVAALKSSLDAMDGKYKTAESRIKEIEDSQAAAIEAAKKEALETARNKGDVSAIEKRYQEQMADLEKRSNETVEQYKARLEALTDKLKTGGRKSIIGDLAAELKIFDDSKPLFEKLIGDRVDVDPETGKETYLDENGGATSLDKTGFLAELMKDKGFDRMRQAEANKGGLANGNNGNGGGASVTVTRAQWDSMSHAQRSELSKSGGKVTD